MTAFHKPTPADCLAPSSGADGLAQIGRSLPDLRGIRYHNADPAAPPSSTPPAPAPTTDPAPAPAPSPAPATPPTPAPATPPTAPANADPVTAPVGGVPFDQLPPETQAEVRRLRQDDQKWRQQLATGMTDEARQKLAEALGLAEAPKDPAALAQSLTETTTRATELESSLAEANRANMVLLKAPDAGGNAALLLDSKGFTETIKGLDPTDAAGITAAIKTWVEKNPSFGTAPGGTLPPTSGGRPQGQPSTPAKPGLAGAIASAQQQATPSR